MGNKIAIVGFIEKGFFRAQISYDKKSYTELSFYGENKAEWSTDIFKLIVENEQIDLQRSACKILILSDVQLSEVQCIPSEKTLAWNWKEIVAVAEASGWKPGKWIVDDKELSKELNRSLPLDVRVKFEMKRYIYSFPAVTIPKKCVPWRGNIFPEENGDSISKKEVPRQKQKIAEPDITSPMPADGSELYNLLSKLAHRPKH